MDNDFANIILDVLDALDNEVEMDIDNNDNNEYVEKTDDNILAVTSTYSQRR